MIAPKQTGHKKYRSEADGAAHAPQDGVRPAHRVRATNGARRARKRPGTEAPDLSYVCRSCEPPNIGLYPINMYIIHHLVM